MCNAFFAGNYKQGITFKALMELNAMNEYDPFISDENDKRGFFSSEEYLKEKFDKKTLK